MAVVVVDNARQAQIRELEGTRAEQVEEELSRIAILGVYEWLAVVLVNEQKSAAASLNTWSTQLVSVQRVIEGAHARYDGVSRQTVLVGLAALEKVGVVSLTGTSFQYAQWIAGWTP
jgi:hypothetical protein